MSAGEFQPESALVAGFVRESCRAVVVIPARNEEGHILRALDALAAQVDLHGEALPVGAIEVLVLLNNCTDRSGLAVAQWQKRNRQFVLHAVERTLPEKIAHVGTARRWLMDTAWQRLARHDGRKAVILSTDADTVVASDWVAQNLRAIHAGADAVGGVIELMDGDLDSLPSGARTSYLRDREYQALVAELEHWLDPQEGDAWPRHLEHFGASLACTAEIYERSGGLPPVKPLEDVAFVDALRSVGARLRHDLKVVVRTSGRLDGRAEVGLSGQLRIWQQMSESEQPHLVQSSEWLIHRFQRLRDLRRLCVTGESMAPQIYPVAWQNRLIDLQRRSLSTNQLLLAIDCERLIYETFRGTLEDEIRSVIPRLRVALDFLRPSQPMNARRSSRVGPTHVIRVS